jgi:ribosomal protein L7Ae-like RNA K-turn-binding protein
MSDNIEKNDTRADSDVMHYFRAGTEKKLLSLLGFAARARKVIAGADLCRDAIRRGHAIITIITADASQNTKKRIMDACNYYGSEMCITTLSSSEISKQIGKTGDIAVAAVTDINFANGIAALFDK